MEKKETKALDFYTELISKGIVEKNEEMRDRLSEVTNWQYAFVTLIKNAHHFHIKILKKDKLIQLVEKYNFRSDFIKNLNV